jgi:hypothetical protein
MLMEILAVRRLAEPERDRKLRIRYLLRKNSLFRRIKNSLLVKKLKRAC